MVAEELTGQVNSVKELAQEHSRWLLRFTNVHVSSNEELIPIIVAARAYKKKIEKGKNSKECLLFIFFCLFCKFCNMTNWHLATCLPRR